MLLAQACESSGGQRHGFFPRRFAEDLRPIGGIAVEVVELLGVFADTGFADQRHGQALRAVGVVETEATFDTQTAVVGRAVPTLDADDFVVFDLVGEQAAHAAEGADRVHFFVHDLVADMGLGHERAGGAGLHAFAAGHASAAAHGVVQIEHDFAVRAAHGVADHVVDLLFAAGAHAAVALDAGIEVHRHRGVRHIGGGLVAAQGFEFGADLHAQAIGPVAQLAVLGRGVGLIPFVAGVGHVGEQHLQHHLLAFDGAFAGGLHLHTGGGAAAAAGCERALAFDLDHAGAAVAVGAVAVFVAKVRDVHPMAFGGFENRLALKSVDGFLVECELHRFQGHLGQLGGCIHIRPPRGGNISEHSAPGWALPGRGHKWRRRSSRC